jgi:integrase
VKHIGGLEMAAKYSRGSVGKFRNQWRGRITRTDQDGTRHNLTRMLRDELGEPIPCEKNTQRGKNTALAALARWRSDLIAEDERRGDGQEDAHDLSGVTLREFLGDYLDMLEGTHHVEQSTLSSYRASARKISSALGGETVPDLTTKQIQAWEVGLLNADGLSSRSVIKHHRLLSQALKYAVDSGALPQNPCDRVKLPKYRREQPHALTKEQAADLMASLEAMPQTRVVCAARVSLLSGLRVGEVCALQWRDVDFQQHVLHVTKAIGAGEGGSYVKAPKNEYSARDVPMNSLLESALRDRRDEIMGKAADAGIYPSPEQVRCAYVLGRLDGKHVNPNCISREWGQLRRLLGVTDSKGEPLRFHDLRHSFATLAVQGHMDVKSLSAILGHADASMTLNVYASSDEQARRAAADKFGEFMGEAERHGQVMQFRKAE